MKKRIAIVGAGPSGITLLINLLNNISDSDISIFDIGHNFYEGNSFNTNSNKLLLNTTVDTTSVFYEDKLHFYNWLKSNIDFHKSKNLKSSFVPRNIASRYLREVLNEYIERSDENNNSVKIHQSFLSKHITNKKFVDTNLKEHWFDFVILCTGHTSSPINIKHNFRKLSGHSSYIKGSFLKIGNKIKTNDNVLIIGSSLSAIDCLILLNEKKHKGQICFLSRSGNLPSVRSDMGGGYSPRFLTLSNFKSSNIQEKKSIFKFKFLLFKELLLSSRKEDIRMFFTVEENPKKQLQIDILNCIKLKNKWQSLIFSALDILTNFWYYFTIEDRVFIKKKYKKIIDRLISSMPLENAILINKYLNTGQLSIIKSLGEDIYYSEQKKGFLIKKSNVVYDKVINSSGINIQNQYCDSLINSLFDSNIIKLEKSKEKIKVLDINNNFECMNDFEDNKSIPKIYVIGTTIKNNLIVANYFLESSRQSNIISNCIKREISKAKNEIK